MHQGLMVRNTVSPRSFSKIQTATQKEMKSVLFKVSPCRAMHSCPRGTGTEVKRRTHGVTTCFRPLYPWVTITPKLHLSKQQQFLISSDPWMTEQLSSAGFTGLARMTTFCWRVAEVWGLVLAVEGGAWPLPLQEATLVPQAAFSGLHSGEQCGSFQSMGGPGPELPWHLFCYNLLVKAKSWNQPSLTEWGSRLYLFVGAAAENVCHIPSTTGSQQIQNHPTFSLGEQKGVSQGNGCPDLVLSCGGKLRPSLPSWPRMNLLRLRGPGAPSCRKNPVRESTDLFAQSYGWYPCFSHLAAYWNSLEILKNNWCLSGSRPPKLQFHWYRMWSEDWGFLKAP